MSKLIGTLAVTTNPRITEFFEVAAWYRTHIVRNGSYNVYHTTDSNHAGLLVTLDTDVVDAYLGTLFGGVAIGSYDKNRELKPSTLRRSCGFYAYQDIIPFSSYGVFIPAADIELPKIGYWKKSGEYSFNIKTGVPA